MTDSQIFQLLGVASCAVGLGIIINADFYGKIVDSFADNPALAYITAIFVLAAGFIIVTFHNIWVMDWPVVITIFGYSALIKGIGLLIFPRAFLALSKAITKNLKHIRFYAAAAFLIGLGLMYLGFVK